MTWFISWLARSAIGRTAVMVAGVLVALLFFAKTNQRKGFKRAMEKANEKDRKRADEIRRAAERARADGVRESDVIYRD